jgi:hypothetical protein
MGYKFAGSQCSKSEVVQLNKVRVLIGTYVLRSEPLTRFSTQAKMRKSEVDTRGVFLAFERSLLDENRLAVDGGATDEHIREHQTVLVIVDSKRVSLTTLWYHNRMSGSKSKTGHPLSHAPVNAARLTNSYPVAISVKQD